MNKNILVVLLAAAFVVSALDTSPLPIVPAAEQQRHPAGDKPAKMDHFHERKRGLRWGRRKHGSYRGRFGAYGR